MRHMVAALLAAALFSIGPDARLTAQDRPVRMVADEGEAARQWPRWRGPSGQGLVSDTGYVDRWSATENVIWKTALPGSGNSSPIVWGDRIIVTTARGDGSQLSVNAYARSDGRLLWETFVPVVAHDSPNPKNGFASATPATDGQRVYASFGRSGLVALNLSDGKLLWHRAFGDLSAYHGAAGSPLLYRDRIVLYQDQTSDPFIAAFDTRTGATVWRKSREGSVGWGSPIAVRVGDHDEIIVSGQRNVIAYNPDDGSELWRCRGTTIEVIPTPVVGYGMVFSSSGRAGPTLAIEPGGNGDVTASHLRWTSPKGSPFVPSPILVGDVLYMVNDMQSIATALEATSGRLLYQGRLGVAQREGFSASPVSVDGKVFFTNDNGETFVLRAGHTFELLHTNNIGEMTLASPALVDGRWYFRTAQNLIAIGQR